MILAKKAADKKRKELEKQRMEQKKMGSFSSDSKCKTINLKSLKLNK